MNFRLNDIVRSAPGCPKGVYVIVELNSRDIEYPYIGKSLLNNKKYKLNNDVLDLKRVGIVDIDWDKITITDKHGTSIQSDPIFVNGKRRAERELIACGNIPGVEISKKRWEILSRANFGDKIKCIVRGREQDLIFRYVTDRGYKYVFIADNSRGVRYKYPLGVILENQ